MLIGGRLIELDAVESTNKTAAELIALSAASHGTVILARSQTAGRGQRGRVWQSGDGLDLTLSIVLQPAGLRAEEQFSIAKLAALAVRDTVAAFVHGAEVRVKWPNDVLVERRKVAGILIECDLVGDLVRSAVVGVGLNVNSSDFPEELAATSLLLAGGAPFDLGVVLEALLNSFRVRYAEWEAEPRALDAAYATALWARGRWAELLLDGSPVLLRPMDVDRHGRLLVEHDDGRVAGYGLDRLRFAAR
jgi:BirA family biotin operon repressor/biotin-[acetyl-CoA-carboxylase] ligase